MTSFNESDINRAADGKFAPKTTSETDTDVLGGDRSLRELTYERYPVDAPDVAKVIGADSATTEMSDWNEVTVRASHSVSGLDAVPASESLVHRRLNNAYATDRFGARIDDGGIDDDGNAELVWTMHHDADDSLDDVRGDWNATFGKQEFDAAMSGSATSVVEGMRQHYRDWGVDPDGSTKDGDVVRPDLSSPTVTNALGKAQTYRKNVSVSAQQAAEAGTLTTTLADGTVETTKDYEAGDYIVTNPDGEQYTMSATKFADRYDAKGDGTYAAKGQVRAVYNPTGHPITVQAPWGEQHGTSDCYIAETYNPDAPDERSTDRYIIGGAEFRNTYASKAWPS